LRIVLDPGATIKLADGSDTSAVRLTAAGASIEGGTIDCNGAGQASGSGIGVSADGCIVRGVTVRDAKTYGIYALNVSGTTIEGCEVVDSGSNGIFVQVASGASESGARVLHNRVDRSSLGA